MSLRVTNVTPLRTVPTIVTAHTFCASPDTRIAYQYRDIFARFKTIRRK